MVIAPYELPIELIVGIIGSVLFIGLLLYRLKHGRKAIRLGAAHSGACASAVSQEEGEGPMRSAAYRANLLKLGVMALLALAACAAYLLVDINPKYFDYAMSLRIPKLVVMLIAAFAIGGASLVFQSVINNTIVTPCLLGMNSLYTLIHTAVVFVAGSGSILAVNANAAFAVDLIIMGLSATVIYGYLFKKTNYNVLYVLLIGTVLTSFSAASNPPSPG